MVFSICVQNECLSRCTNFHCSGIDRCVTGSASGWATPINSWPGGGAVKSLGSSEFGINGREFSTASTLQTLSLQSIRFSTVNA